MDDERLAEQLATNIRQLREARGLTQQQIAKVAGVPRATWQNLESGAANPTISVLWRVGSALQVSLEELCAAPRASGKKYDVSALKVRTRGRVGIRSLLPNPIPGMGIERMELPPGARFSGVPHTPGTREYLTCESGSIVLRASGDEWTLGPGDVVVFRGDQRHSYDNPGAKVAIAYSVVLLAPMV
jgi:transcriptional regulator with XRE-family HTH domain